MMASSFTTSNGGTPLTRYARYTAKLSPVPVSANTCAAQKFTFKGLVAADILIGVNKPTEQPGLGVSAGHVVAADTVTINFCNNTGSSITPSPNEAYNVVVVQ